MKSLSVAEVALLAKSLEDYLSCRFQRLETGADWLDLMFYGRGEERHLFVSLKAQLPMLLLAPAPGFLKRHTVPMQLFLRAHFENHFLSRIELDPQGGRVLFLVFSNGGRIEIRLFPHGQNWLAMTADGKKMSFFKVREKAAGVAFTEDPTRAIRTHEVLKAQWLESQFSAEKKQDSAVDRVQKNIEKKKRAIEVMKIEIEEKKNAPFQQLGEWLKIHQTLEVPADWAHLIQPKLSFSENLKNLFEKAKQNRAKTQSAELRLQALEKELQELEAKALTPDSSGSLSAGPGAPEKPSLMVKAKARGRSVELSSGHFLFIGRNAEENLKILRSAQAWDYWLHLKDIPGCHGIIKRNKGEKISDKVLTEALQNLVRTQFQNKIKNYLGERFDGLVAECRHVRPIKGDRMGRVNYQNERVLTFLFKG